MSEQLLNFTNTNEYRIDLGDKRTARHASEESHQSPSPRVVDSAVRDIRSDLTPTFKGGEHRVSQDLSSLTDMKRDYWIRASQVGIEHGARAGYELEDYFTIGEGRSYLEIKKRTEADYDDTSVPRSVLDGIDIYHKELEINPAYAATITMEMIGSHLSVIKGKSEEYQKQGYEITQATSQAVADFITHEIPDHINNIKQKYGTGESAIRPAMNKSSFYPEVDKAAEEDSTLVLSENDAAGLIEVYDIQSRPYDTELLQKGNAIAHIPAMQKAMLQVQKGLIDESKRYFEAHPERARGNLENFSEIFVPRYNDRGEIEELLPNPKLIRAMVNNVMPGVALNLRRREASIHEITEEDIQEGVKIAAKEYKLFQTCIGQFNNPDQQAGTIELQSTFKVVCPANALFPGHLTKHMALYFAEAKEATSSY